MTRTMTRRWLPRLGLLVGIIVVVLGPAAPAAAHDVGGVGATNFHTTLSDVRPAVPGLTVTVIENGSRLELRNTTGTEVVVAGYEGEPYARVGPDGVFLNDNSPATYLNASRYGTQVPAGVDPGKAPAWRQVDTARVLRWHDHRIHWMSATLPPAVAADPGSPHRISAWTIQLSYGRTPLTVAGTLEWVPGPNPWPWFALVALIVAGLAAVPLLRRPHRLLAGAAIAGVAAEIAHGVGVMLVEVGSVPQRLGALFGSEGLLLWPFVIFGAWLLWKGHTRALWIAAAAGFVMATMLVLSDAPVWWRSSAPTALPATANRLMVALVVGAGAGLAAALPLMLRRYGPPPRPWSVPTTVANSTMPDQTPTEAASKRPPDPDPDADPDADAAAEPIIPALAAPGSIGRRHVTGALAAGALGALAGAAAGATFAAPRQAAPPPTGTSIGDVGARAIAFFGDRQAGIVRPGRPQARAWIAGFDLADGVDRAALARLMHRWSEAAEALMAGRGLGHADDAVVAGLGPSALTITVGVGPSLFGKAGLPLAERPAALAPLPAFPSERLDPARGGGDLGVVVAADDPIVVTHAARVLCRVATGVAAVRWRMSGFNAARGNGDESATGRNLMGQVDGTNNPKPSDTDFAARIFAAGPAWLHGGSYLVVRRIRMLLDAWDQVPLAEQERVIGRNRQTGAPLSGGGEFTPANFGAINPDGTLVIPSDAHMRLAAPAFNDGAAMLRRGFSYSDEDSSGLLFLAWQADPRRGFIPVQRRLVASDALGRFIRHESSALFAMPGGVAPGGYIGQSLLEG